MEILTNESKLEEQLLLIVKLFYNKNSIDNLKFHSNDYTTFDISKKPILSDEEINRNFSSFNKYFAESWKMYDEGTKYADDLVDELY